uniref:Secreted protein n=1 Tax=Arundo donax TaxID=35708 RepID=A0A0A9FKF9_ARUDO
MFSISCWLVLLMVVVAAVFSKMVVFKMLHRGPVLCSPLLGSSSSRCTMGRACRPRVSNASWLLLA